MHKLFTLTSLISLGLILITIIVYNYYLIQHTNNYILYGLKPIPVSIMIITVFIYFIIYQSNTYSMLILISLCACLIGDVLLLFYDSKQAYTNTVYLIIGGGFFFLGKIFMSVAFLIFPFNYENPFKRVIKFTLTKTLLVFFPTFLLVFGPGLNIVLKINNITMAVFISIYFIIMFVNLFLSFMRIRGFVEELLRSQIVGGIGTLLFTLGDILLFWNIFISSDKITIDVISITLYWIGLYIITISIVRTGSYNTEVINIDVISQINDI